MHSFMLIRQYVSACSAIYIQHTYNRHIYKYSYISFDRTDEINIKYIDRIMRQIHRQVTASILPLSLWYARVYKDTGGQHALTSTLVIRVKCSVRLGRIALHYRPAYSSDTNGNHIWMSSL